LAGAAQAAPAAGLSPSGAKKMGFSSGAQEVAKVSHRCHQLWLEDPEVTGVLNGKILYKWGDFPANHV